MTSAKSLLPCLIFVIQGLLSACQSGSALNRTPITELSIVNQWNSACIDAYQRRDEIINALDLSLNWLNKTESHFYYPVAGITHDEATVCTQTFRKYLLLASNPEELSKLLNETFDLFTYNQSVLFTGYFAPEYDGALTRSEEYRYPLYSAPSELVFDSISRNAIGWKTETGVIECPTRLQLHQTNQLIGREIVWLKDPMDAYIIHVNGSGRIILPDGKHINVGHTATNGHTYMSLGKLLIEDGHIKAEDMSLQAIRKYFYNNPDQFNHYALQNNRFVFFEVLEDNHWPRGALGLKLTPMHTIATDKQVYPPGCVALVITVLTSEGGNKPLIRFMIDQDSGGAIKTPGRVDIYMGVGKQAGEVAGRQISRGKVYYPILKR